MLEHDRFELNRRGCLAHLAPLAGRGQITNPVGGVTAHTYVRNLRKQPLTPTLQERASLVSTPKSGEREKWSTASVSSGRPFLSIAARQGTLPTLAEMLFRL
jgi:hypothetical protein